MQNTPAPKKTSCLSACNLTVESSSWGMLCLQSHLVQAVRQQQQLTLLSPSFLQVLGQSIFFSEPHLLAFLTSWFITGFFKRFKKPFPHNWKILSCSFTLFHTLLLPPSQSDVLLLKTLEHTSVRIFPWWVRQGLGRSPAYWVREKSPQLQYIR